MGEAGHQRTPHPPPPTPPHHQPNRKKNASSPPPQKILCDRDSYLMELIRYLHSNPVLAGVVSDPSRYSWSSH